MTTAADLRTALLGRVAWGVRAGSAVELRPGGPVTLADARAHVAHLGPRYAERVTMLPAVRDSRLRPLAPLSVTDIGGAR